MLCDPRELRENHHHSFTYSQLMGASYIINN